GGTSYLWDTGATTESITVSPSSTKTYSVTVRKNGCEDTDQVKVTVNPVEISDLSDSYTMPASNEILSLDIYPNPSDGIININVENYEQDFNILINDSKGSLIYYEKSNNQQDRFSRNVDLSRFTDGIYFVRLLSSDQNLVKTLVII
ncbi:MAG: T9SS type A sorting domain-containing protein, partial [Flavobacteriales bacterium]|nr:T9SS type A sorting domain-containing protein [Flavobacteriales bacterium]